MVKNKDSLINSFRKNNYEVTYFEKGIEAIEYLDRHINEKTVGFGDSATLKELGLYELLIKHNKVYDPQHCEADESFNETAAKCLLTEIFLTSVNAATENGEIINIDGTGNRVAGSLFGHKKVYFVFSTNKIEPTMEKAVWRAKNIAAPQNAQRLGLHTPCAIKGNRCYDCSSPDRICNGLILHLKKMNDCEMEVIIINEVLGY